MQVPIYLMGATPRKAFLGFYSASLAVKQNPCPPGKISRSDTDVNKFRADKR